jgi:hypothetical protein
VPSLIFQCAGDCGNGIYFSLRFKKSLSIRTKARKEKTSIPKETPIDMLDLSSPLEGGSRSDDSDEYQTTSEGMMAINELKIIGPLLYPPSKGGRKSASPFEGRLRGMTNYM